MTVQSCMIESQFKRLFQTFKMELLAKIKTNSCSLFLQKPSSWMFLKQGSDYVYELASKLKDIPFINPFEYHR